MTSFSERFTSSPDHVERIRLKAEEIARGGGFDEVVVADIGLCINEAIANVLEHAYGGAEDKPVEVKCEFSGSEFQATIRDWGSGVDPSKLPVKEKDPYEPGGLGLICMRKMLDRVEYAPQPDGGMLLTIGKKLKR